MRRHSSRPCIARRVNGAECRRPALRGHPHCRRHGGEVPELAPDALKRRERELADAYIRTMIASGRLGMPGEAVAEALASSLDRAADALERPGDS